MKLLLLSMIFLMLLFGCQSSFQSHDNILEQVNPQIEYISGFSSLYDDFEIKSIEYLEDNDRMYYLIYYNGSYKVDVDILGIKAGDPLESRSLCTSTIDSLNQECFNDLDVSGEYTIVQLFWQYMKDKTSHNYYIFSEAELDDLNEKLDE